MEARQVQPDLVCFSSFLSALVTNDATEEQINEFLEKCKTLNLELNDFMNTNLILYYGKGKQFAKCLEVTFISKQVVLKCFLIFEMYESNRLHALK